MPFSSCKPGQHDSRAQTRKNIATSYLHSMPCTGKGGSNSCSCKVFESNDADTVPSSKCQFCKHKKKHHTAPTTVSDVLAKFDLARLKSKKAGDEQARQETNRGFRGGKGSDAAKAKSGSSRVRNFCLWLNLDLILLLEAAAPEPSPMVKVGSLQIITCGLVVCCALAYSIAN